MKLYFAPGACSLAVHIALREAALPFTLERVDTTSHTTETGADFHAVNSRGQVPVLEFGDGQRMTEGAVIAQYVADQANAGNLIPSAGSLPRYRVLEWQNYVGTELHKAYTPLFNPALDAQAKRTLVAVLRGKYEWLDARLRELSATGHDFLTGASFTVADAYLFTVSRWARFVDLDLSGLPSLHAYLARVGERDAVRAALQAEGLAA